MADNVTAGAPVGTGATFATDDIAGVQHPKTKIEFGASDSATQVADADGSRLPVKVGDALPAGNNNIGDVDVASLPALPAGTNNIGDVDVLTLPALPAGTNAIGKLAANSGVDIGDVDVTSLPSTSAAGATTAADNSANSSTKAPVLSAKATAASPSWTEGNQVPLSTTLAGSVRTIVQNSSPIDVNVATALPAGTNAIGKLSANSGVDIGDVDVTSLPALPTGSNAIGKLAANSGIDIGDVDVTSIIPGTGATNLGKAADAVAGATDTGIPAYAIRDDVLTTLTPADGDYAPLRVNSTGALHVTGGGGGTQYVEDVAHASGDTGTLALAVRLDANTTLVDTTGDYAPLQVDANGALKVNITAGAGSGGTASTDDAAFTVASGSGTPIMGLADETSPDSVDEGDVGVVRMTLARGLHANIRDDAGDSCMDGANNALRVNIVAGAGSGGTAMTDDAAFTPATTSVTPMGAMADEVTPDSVDEGDIGAVRMSLNRNLYTQIRDISSERSAAVSAANALKVDGSAVTQPVSGTVTANAGTGPFPVSDNGGSLTVDGSVSVAALPASTNTLEVVGDVAHDAVSAGNPVLMGAYAKAAAPTDVSADGDTVNLWADRAGRLQVGDGGGSLTVDGSVSVAALPASTNTLEVVGDVAHDAVSAGNPVLIGGYAKAAAPSDVSADGDTVNIWCDRAGRVQIGDGGGSVTVDGTVTANAGTGPFPVSDNGGSLTVDGTVSISGTVTVDTELPAAAALANDTANPTVPGVGAFNMVFDGTNWDRQPGTSASGAFVQGDVAHDVAVAANPLLVGGRASAAAPSDVSADGDAVRAWMLRNGAQATVVTAAGALVGGDATNGLDVDVTRLSALVTGSAVIGQVGLEPRTSGGLTISKTVSAASTNATSVKGSAGQVYGWFCSNVNAAVRYLKLYNKATSPTVGTDTPVMTIAIPGNTAGAGCTVEFTNGIAFGTGIALALTTEATDAGSTGVAASEIVVNLLYK